MKAATGSKKRRDEKHVLRKEFHRQLKVLWQQMPLKDHQDLLKDQHTMVTGWETDQEGTYYTEEKLTLLQKVREFQFAPTVSAKLHMVADLTITLLRPELPGQIVTQSGDIDNRLKTLLDALKVPNQPDDLPHEAIPLEGERPFFCLLEDDNLITSLDIKTDRLLDHSAGPSEVVLLIHVRTRLLMGTVGNLGLV